MMSKKMNYKKIVAIVLSMLMITSLLMIKPIKSKALVPDGETLETAIPINLNTTYGKTVEYWEHDYFTTFYVPSSGVLKFTVLKPVESNSYRNLTFDLTKDYGKTSVFMSLMRGQDTNSDYYTFEVGVTAGTYELCMEFNQNYSYNTLYITYRVDFESCTNHEIEPNEKTSQATVLPFNQMYKASFGDWDGLKEKDYYKFNVTGGAVSSYDVYIDNYGGLINESSSTGVHIISPSGEEKKITNFYPTSTAGKYYFSIYFAEAGTYYVYIENSEMVPHLLPTTYKIGVYEKPTAVYRTHIQSIGWQNYCMYGMMSGTSGQAKRLEGIQIGVDTPDNVGIQYTTHCQSYGWLPWSSNHELNGTEGEAKRLEAIKIQLTGANKDKYDVYYRVHAQSFGWLNWAKNGTPAGTAGYGKRLEGIQIVVVRKGDSFDVNSGGISSARGECYIAKSGNSPVVNSTATSATNPVVPGQNSTNVAYRTHVQSFGWQGWKYNGQMSGTSGLAKRLEGINIELRNKQYSGSIVYTTHVQTYGWQGNPNDTTRTGWKRDGQMSGTSGEAKRLEAICVALTGEMANRYDIYYRVHAQSFGWLGWAKNGEESGTAGYAKRLEGIQIVLVPKGGAAPANNYGGVTSVRAEAYIQK